MNFPRLLGTALAAIVSGLAVPPPAARAQEDAPPAPTVMVTADKQPVVKTLDKTAYDVSDMARAANGNAQDVLQSTPGVSVTADGQIAVKGNPQVTVLVDGKPTAMMAGSSEERAVALQTMSGADIASVEVITNPSAAYDANGGAILNIVLKRQRTSGAHGQVQGSASNQGLWNGGASGDLARREISVRGSLALRHDGTQKFRESTVDWHTPLGGQSGRTRQSSEVFVHRVVQSAAFGIDDTLSDTDSLGFSARYNKRRSRPVFDVLNQDRTGAADSLYHRISDGPNEQSDGSATLDVSHRGPGTALKAMLQHSDTDALVDKSYRDVFIEPARATDYDHGASKLARHLNQATLDWTHSYQQGDEHRQWGMGLDVQDKVDELANYQAAVDPSTGAETPDPNTTNGYSVRTTLGAAYLTGRIAHGNWETLLGERAERMALRVSPAQSAAPAGHWHAYNPSLHLKYALGALSDQAGLTLSYRRSLQMPDPRDLDPYTTYVDAHNLSRGNPGLQPQRVTAWELGVDTGAGQVSTSASVFYRRSRDTVLDARTIQDDVLITSRQNGGQARSTGVSGSLDWTPDTRLRLGMDGGAQAVRLDSPDLAGLVQQHGVSGYLNLRAGYRVGGDELSLDAHGQSARITPLGRDGATSSVNLSWKHVLGRTLSLTVNANDIFDGSRRSYRVDSSTFRQAGFDHFVAQRLYVGLVDKI